MKCPYFSDQLRFSRQPESRKEHATSDILPRSERAEFNVECRNASRAEQHQQLISLRTFYLPY